MYRTAIFDLDGTLLDTLQDLADSANYALALHGLPARTVEEVRQFVGNGVGLLIRRAVPEGTPEELERQVLRDFRAHYLVNMENKTAPYPGVPELLDALGAAGVPTAVVSNKFDGAVKGLCQNYFGDRIGAAIGESQGVARKPAPDTVFRALAELGMPREGAVDLTLYDGDRREVARTTLHFSTGAVTDAFSGEDGNSYVTTQAETQVVLLLFQVSGTELRCALRLEAESGQGGI